MEVRLKIVYLKYLALYMSHIYYSVNKSLGIYHVYHVDMIQMYYS